MTLVDDVVHARKPEVLSVTQAVEKLNKILSFDDYIVEGEISEFQDKGWANVYFTLKDSTTGASSIMRCAMWTNAYRNQNLPLEVGMKIEAVGRFEVYAPKGDMSFRVSKFSIAGRGDLRAQVEALAKKLRSEGLTDESRKRPIPAFPETIGLVTSPRGAVVHDMLRTLKRRWPLAAIKVAGVPVEGKTAPEKMKEGIAACIAAGCEVILLGRGGGSFEDLMPFNDEQLARAVAASPVPIITAVGHEIDTTICDLVSDKRASTPTMAAEFASAFSNEDMLHEISFRADKLTRDMKRRFESSYSVLQGIQNKKYFADAHELYSDDLNYLDMNYEKIRTMLATFLDAPRHDVELQQTRFMQYMNEPFVRDSRDLDGIREMMVAHMQQFLDHYSHELELSAQRLHDISPLSVMERGYAIVRNKEGEVISSVDSVTTDDGLEVTLHDGHVKTRVVETQKR